MKLIDAGYVMKAINRHLKHPPVGQYEAGFNDGLNTAILEIMAALTQSKAPLTLEQAKKEKYIWFEPLKEWGKVTPDGVLFFGTEEWSTWEILNENWGYRCQVYRYPPEGKEDIK